MVMLYAETKTANMVQTKEKINPQQYRPRIQSSLQVTIQQIGVSPTKLSRNILSTPQKSISLNQQQSKNRSERFRSPFLKMRLGCQPLKHVMHSQNWNKWDQVELIEIINIGTYYQFYSSMRRGFSKIIDMDVNPEDMLQQCSSPPSQLIKRSSIMNITPRVIEKIHQFYSMNEYLTLNHILQKPHDARNHNENKYLIHFIHKIPYLKSLTQIIGIEFARGIMRSANLIEYDEYQIIEYQHQPISSVFIILEGKIGTIKTDLKEDEPPIQMKEKYIFQSLSMIARKQMKKMSKLTRKFSSIRSQKHTYNDFYQGLDDSQILEFYERNSCYGTKDRCFSKQFAYTAVALQKTITLSIDINNIFYWLNHSFEQKIAKSFELLKNHPCFNYVDNELLEQIIQTMTIEKRKKMDVIYNQGDESTHIYFLDQGQLKIIKNANLFVENPNQFYVDRRKLLENQEKSQLDYLPYANLKSLYNYRPINKAVDIGIINPFSLFGEEQILENRKRETSVICNSLEVRYYRLQIDKIYQILNDKVPIFLKAIKQSIKRKVLYRQDKFATAVNMENKNNLNYFYYEGDKTLPTPRKYKIQKFNERIAFNHSAINVRSKDQSTIQPQEQRLSKKEQSEKLQKSIPPFYNTFNFHKMMNTKLKSISLLKTKEEDYDPQGLITLREPKMYQIDQQLLRQKTIIGNSHTWRLIKQKVKEQVKISKKMGSFKHTIDFAHPLIDDKYFRQIEVSLKKMEREKRTQKFTVSSVKKSRSANKSISQVE